MKPLNIDKTGCSNTSSNCVVWQGPDIECINLCKGDSITEVVYKLAKELCGLMDTFDLKNYDLKCFSIGVCQPQTFQDFINILINKVCALQECNPQCGDSCNPCPTPPANLSSAQTTNNGGDIYVPIAKEFQFDGPTGDPVTMLKTSDYAQAIGNKVSTLVNSINVIQNTLVDHSIRIEALENQGTPTVELPTVTPVGVLPKNPTSMQLVLSATEQQFVELRSAIGSTDSIYKNIAKIDSAINDLPSLSVPGKNISTFSGFNTQPANMADVIGNILVIVGDMRTAVTNILKNYIPSDCESISIDLSAKLNSTNQLVLYFTGSLPSATFINTGGAATVFTITDTHGSSASYSVNIFSVINNPNGYIIDIASSRLVLSDNLTITANPSFTSKTNGSVCKSYLNYVVMNDISCPSVVYSPTNNSIAFSFVSSSGTLVYTLDLLAEDGVTLIASQNLISTNSTTLTGTFSGLNTNTIYKVRVKTGTNNSILKSCELTSITTL